MTGLSQTMGRHQPKKSEDHQSGLIYSRPYARRSAANHSLHCLSLIRTAKTRFVESDRILSKQRPPPKRRPRIHTNPSLQLELEFKLQLDSSWEEKVAATSGSRKRIPVYDPKGIVGPVRLPRQCVAVIRAKIPWTIPNVPIEGIEEVHLKQNVAAFCNLRAFQQVEILAEIGSHSDVPVNPRRCAESVRASGGNVLGRVWVVKRGGKRIDRRVQRVEHRNTRVASGKGRGCNRNEVPASAFPGRTERGRSRDVIEANAISVGRNSRGAAERDRLAALVALDAADRPPANRAIQEFAAIEEFLVPSKWKLVNITDHEVLGKVLVADGLVALFVEHVLWRAALVQRREIRQRRVGLRQRLRPRVGGHQV